MKVVEAGMRAKKTATPLQAKTAVPPAGIDAPEHVFGGAQPQAGMLQLQRTLGTAVEANGAMVAALERQCEVHVSTGNQFVEQWKPQYLSDTFCFDFPRGASGPEFTTVINVQIKRPI